MNMIFACGRGIAITMKNMLEAAYPGINVILANHPPALPKRLLSKAVLVVQVGITATIMVGEQIFPRFGIMTPPPWYHSLRANRFGSIASVWFFGNFLQSSLQSTGAFEVYCNGEFVSIFAYIPICRSNVRVTKFLCQKILCTNVDVTKRLFQLNQKIRKKGKKF